MSTQTSKTAETLVVGGGAVGLAIALELVSLGQRVVHVFPTAGDATSASRAAGAMLGAFGEVTADDGPAEIAELDFRLAAQRLYPAWLEKIRGLSRAEIFEAKGTVIIANNQGVRDRDSIQRMRKEAEARNEPADWIEPRDVPGLKPARTYEPSLCLFLGNEHAVHSGELADAVVAALKTFPGYRRVDAEVRELARQGEAWRATTSTGETVDAAAAVLAGGSRAVQCLSTELAEAAGVPNVYFGKGIACLVTEGPAVRHTIRTPNRAFTCGVHMVPRSGQGHVYVGATNFMGKDQDAALKNQPGELHGLFDDTIHQLNTDIRTARIESLPVGFRPIGAFKRPAVGRTRLPNLYLATGTYRNGVLMAPLIATFIASEMGCVPSPLKGANPFAVTLGLDPHQNTERLFDIGVRDLVVFLQEPRGPLPFNRAGELEAYVRGLFELAFVDGKGNAEWRETIQKRIEAAPFNETIHMLFYDIAEDYERRRRA